MGSYRGTAPAVAAFAPHARRPEGGKVGKGTIFTRADKAANKTAPSGAEVRLLPPKQLGQSRLSPYFSRILKWSTPSRSELGAEPDGEGITETVALRALPQIKSQFSSYRT